MIILLTNKSAFQATLISADGFPKSFDPRQSCHLLMGIPVIRNSRMADIINTTTYRHLKDGCSRDTSKSFHCRKPSISAQRCRDVAAWMHAWLVVDMVKPGIKLGDIGHAINNSGEWKHFWCSEILWHDFGQYFRGAQVLHYGHAGYRDRTVTDAGQFTIEPHDQLPETSGTAKFLMLDR